MLLQSGYRVNPGSRNAGYVLGLEYGHVALRATLRYGAQTTSQMECWDNNGE